jgi:hypothetical protein
MSFPTRIKTWTKEILYASDLNAEFTNLISALSDGTKEVAFAYLGVGTTTNSYLCNLTTSTSSRALSIAQTLATGTVLGEYIGVTGASTTNHGLYTNVSGATLNYDIYCSGNDVSYVKLPYWAAAPAGAVANGSIVVGVDSGNYYIFARANGAWKKVQVS